jgi:hypothetical protein
VLAAAALLTLSAGCVSRSMDKPVPGGGRAIVEYFPLTPEKDVDLLFVIDNSNSMGEEQDALATKFDRLIESLRSEKLGQDRPDGPPCTAADRRNCRIPNVRIGVVSSDLGAGNYSLPSCEVAGGDKGRLQTTARSADCPLPKEPWISYVNGVTNVAGGPAGDPVGQVREAFKCIAMLGVGGCGFEQQLEAARRALDDKVNPGFLRKDAFLAVVFITDEDDCSAQKPQLFDPAQQGVTDPLGPLTSFRCTEFGVSCDKNGRQPGVRNGCVPGFDWLHKVEEYGKFFASVKPLGRTFLFAIAGPEGPFEVGLDGPRPILKASCQGTTGNAVPAVRLASVVKSMGERRGYFNRGVDPAGKPVEVNICSNDYAPALRLIGDQLITVMTTQCIPAPPATKQGSVVCAAGDALAPGTTCRQSCLDQADCVVNEIVGQGTAQERYTPVDRCPTELFTGERPDCGASCPCWRIVKRSDCDPARRGSPYAIEILRKGEPVKGAVAAVQCAGSVYRWGAPELADAPQCY